MSPDVARRLTEILVEATAPGGKLLVANFVPDHGGIENTRVFQIEPCFVYLEVTRTP